MDKTTCQNCRAKDQIVGQRCLVCERAVVAAPDDRDSVEYGFMGRAFEGETLEPGTIIGNYEVVGELGRGGMGVVYHVRRSFGRQAEYALKLIRPEISTDPRAVERFVDEVETAQGLAHPNILRVHQLENDEGLGLCFFTMEMLQGRDLGQVIRERKKERGDKPPLFTLEEACAVLRPTLEALRYSHGRSRPVIHCDLKPENIMVLGEFPDVRIKVLDFGFARMLSAESRSSAVRAEGGNYECMAPEQWNNEPISRATDIFPVGVMLYQMLAGVIPRGYFAPVTRKVPGLPPVVDDFIAMALQQDPKDRYQNAGMMIQALENLLAPHERAEAASASPPAASRSARVASGGSGPAGHAMGDFWTEPHAGMEFAWVPGGTSMMGSPGDDAEAGNEEKPQHKVMLDGFWLARHPVTQAQWERIMGYNPSHFRGDALLPVDSVSWDDVRGFLETLSERSGRACRLPTEAEWEYAARSAGRNERFAGGGEADALAWHAGNSDRKTHPVGEKKPNGLGIFDMSGNVFEWVEDRYSENAYANHALSNPRFEGSMSLKHVLRGGSWNCVQRDIRTAARYARFPNVSENSMGFRVAMNGQQRSKA